MRIYPKTKILKLNRYSLAVGDWTHVPYFQRKTKQRQEAYHYLFNTLYSQWLPLPHFQYGGREKGFSYSF
jgi:hypothetical protein